MKEKCPKHDLTILVENFPFFYVYDTIFVDAISQEITQFYHIYQTLTKTGT